MRKRVMKKKGRKGKKEEGTLMIISGTERFQATEPASSEVKPTYVKTK